jgi:hypothetical protein
MKKLESRELRIGNWVSMAEYGVQQISSYNIYQLNLMEAGAKVADYYHLIEPIPLTEEWLVKFGFFEKYKSTSNRWNIKWFEIHDIEDDNGYLEGRFMYDFRLHIQHVHNLQNLYFALTGEELTLKQ